MHLFPLGDTAVVIELGASPDEWTHRRVVAATALLEAARLPGITDVVAAYTTVTLHYDFRRLAEAAAGHPPVPWLLARVESVLGNLDRTAGGSRSPRSSIEIPVCYGGDYGPDLELVARHAKLGVSEVIELHSRAEYRVAALGFAPGFPYLLGLPAVLATPRRAQPRLQVLGGSVGIAGRQTGIYPLPTPGGWNLIGRTPLRLFDPSRTPPTRLNVGDRVRFRVITPEAFASWPANSPSP